MATTASATIDKVRISFADLGPVLIGFMGPAYFADERRLQIRRRDAYPLEQVIRIHPLDE